MWPNNEQIPVTTVEFTVTNLKRLWLVMLQTCNHCTGSHMFTGTSVKLSW